jgi:hypothetical protein
MTLPDCPVEPPIGRGINLQRMQYIQLDFDTIRQAVKFAFYNSCAKRGTGWKRTMQSLSACVWNQWEATGFDLC